MSPDPERTELDKTILAWMTEPWVADETRFGRIALDLFAFQYERCRPYALFCKRRGLKPENVTRWQDIPRIPTGAFKEVDLRSFPKKFDHHIFRTSGTSVHRRGTLHLDTLSLYERSLVPSFERGVLPDVNGKVRMLVLAPTAEEAPDSSLSHMFTYMLKRRGNAASLNLVQNGSLDIELAIENLKLAEATTETVLVCGAAFAFVHLLERMKIRDVKVLLGPQARIMETGGFKGKSRTLVREELYESISNQLNVPEDRIVNQYGMTELGSQFYDSILLHPEEPRRKIAPPWTRVFLTNPSSGEEVGEGEVGLLSILDLANTGSVFAIQTADLGRRLNNNFEIVGRATGAEARGCSIAVDLLLQDTEK